MIPRLLICGLVFLLMATAKSAEESESLLADAAQRKDRTTVRLLLERGVPVNDPQVDGMTAIHWASYYDDLQTATWLMDAGADVTLKSRYGVTPLFLACRNGNAVLTRLLLEAGADPNVSLRGGETPLMTAARTGRPGPVRALLAQGAEVNARERQGQTALMWAAADGHENVVRALIEADADFRTPLKSGFTPFFFAVREGRADVALRLLSAGANVNDAMQPQTATGRGPRPGTCALILAVENGHLNLAADLLEAGADPTDMRCGFTALHAITWVRKPIRGDGDPPPVGSGNLSSLEFVRKLVAHGADVNARHRKHSAKRDRLNRTGGTPFLLAAEAADAPLMQLLVELGADPLLPNADNCSPLLAAAGVGVLSDGDEAAGTEDEAIAAVRLLLEWGADINAVDDQGKSAMHGAAYKSRPKLVRFLHDHGADISVWNRRSRRGWTPLQIAQGHRPGNFRPSPETIRAIQQIMETATAETSLP